MADSIISKTASIGDNTSCGNFCTIGENVKIGNGCKIGHNVVIHDDSSIGDNVRIGDVSVSGKRAMRAAKSAVTRDDELRPCKIDSDCIIGTHVIIYRGSDIGAKVLIADLATIREQVTIGQATIVGRGVAIENKCDIGKYVKLETNVYITAYSRIEDRVFVAPCVATSNDNFVGRTKERFKHFKGVIMKRGARVGVNATILPGKTIGEDSLVGAGALIHSDTPPKKIVVGVPGKPLRDVPEEQLLENQGWEDE